MLLRCIRRANLDAMWSREPKTVESNRREIERSIKLSIKLGIDPKFEALGPYPCDEDVQGISVAVIILKRSLEPGGYADYIQFEIARKLRSTHANLYHASAKACVASSTLGRN